MTNRRWLIALGVAVVAVGLIVVVTARRGDDAGGQRSGAVVVSSSSIPVGGGTSLVARVARPADTKRAPLVVMPASWGQLATEYDVIARELASSGFTVVSYAQRGFGGSGGQVDLAGATTQSDAGKVIDWALAEQNADPERIGMYGISYGAGVSLLAAAKDPRIKSVVALSTWADLGASFDTNGTVSSGALSQLLDSATTARLTPEIRRLKTQLKSEPTAVGATFRALSPSRSPSTYLAQLNRNKPAVMMANSFEDSLFPPAQLNTFFDALTTAKRLQLGPGDHGTRDVAGLKDGRTGTAGDAKAWLAHFLQGADNGIETEKPLILTDAASGALSTTTSFSSGARTLPIRLGRPNSAAASTDAPAAVWRSSMLTGTDTVATSGAIVAPFSPYQVPRARLAGLDQSRGLAWSHVVGDEPITVTGAARVSFEISSNRSTATVVSYLYDLDTSGESRLMTTQPLSLRGLTPRRAKATSFDLQPIVWTVPAGHAVVLVLDTVDPRFTGLNRSGTVISVSSVQSRPATMTLPIAR